jgi:hypothetical protein
MLEGTLDPEAPMYTIDAQSRRRLADRLGRAKAAYTTRHARLADAAFLLRTATPRAGDLLLARVDQIGHHKALELRSGRRATLFEGDEIVVVYGNRYAPDQFEAEIATDLRACELVAAGGVASCVLSRHDKTRKPTRIEPIGLLCDEAGNVLNLSRYALPSLTPRKSAYVLAVFGASMNAGKTTTAVSLIRGFAAAGYRVGSAKVTGTGAGGDLWLMLDAGADPALDFTAAGAVSTYQVDRDRLIGIFSTLTAHAMNAGIDVLIIEVADGVYQQETAMLAQSAEFRGLVDGVVFAARDALGAKAGVDWLRENSLDVLAISGTVTMAPLAIQETTEAVGLPVLGPTELAQATTARELLAPLQHRKVA